VVFVAALLPDLCIKIIEELFEKQTLFSFQNNGTKSSIIRSNKIDQVNVDWHELTDIIQGEKSNNSREKTSDSNKEDPISTLDV
jgi:hypothetical protein